MQFLQKNKNLLIILVFIFAFFLSVWKIWEDKVIFTDELFIEDISYGFSKGEWYLTPTINNRPDLSKPPLLYWTTGPFYKILNPSPLTRRLPNIVFSIILITTAYFFVKKHFSKTKALFAIILLTSNAIFLIFSKAANFDFANASLGFLALYFYNLGKEKNKYYYPATVILALSFLTRSFLSVFPIVVIFCDLIINKSKPNLKTIFSNLLLYFILTLPWILYIYLKFRDYFFGQFLGLVFSKHLTGLIEGDVKTTPFYYLVIFLLFPLALLIPFALFKKRKKYSSIDLQMVFWFIGGFLILSFAQTRHLWYGVFLIIPVSILVADYLFDHVFTKGDITAFNLVARILVIIGITIYPLYFIIFGAPETDVTHAIKIYKNLKSENTNLYFWNYSLVPITRFYPGFKIDVLVGDNIEMTNKSDNNYLIIRPWEMSEVKNSEIIFRGTDTNLIKITQQE